MFVICDEAIARAQIVIHPEASPVEVHAAEELKEFIHKMTGKELPVTDDTRGENLPIFIGTAVPERTVSETRQDLSVDGFAIHCDEKQLSLFGAQPRSSLYAVYHLLEHHLGCGFFEDGDQVPTSEILEVGPISEHSTPRFGVRIFEGPMPLYSGGLWWTWEEFRPWLDWMAKKRFNVLYANRLLYCGLSALAARRMGVDIPLTDFQKERLRLLRRAFDYARLLGMRIFYTVDTHIADTRGMPGASPHADGKQLLEFIRRYPEQTGRRVPTYSTTWCGLTNTIIDIRDDVGQEFIRATVGAIEEHLGTDHMYQMWFPTEESVSGMDPDAAVRITYDQVFTTIDAIRSADPLAEIWSPRVCTDNPTAEAQARAVRDAGLPVHGNYFLHLPGRPYDFLQCDYYWKLPWSTGMCVECGRETNPNGDIRTAVLNAREVANSPETANCVGFHVSTETIHRNLMSMDLYGKLAWNPNSVNPEEFIRRWSHRRYGPVAGGPLVDAVTLYVEALLSGHDMATHHGPLYRNWDGTQLPGLTSSSVKRLIGRLPDLEAVLRMMLDQHEHLEGSPLYRFDLVDLGRTYLAAIFNDRLARARAALRSGRFAEVERHSREAEDIMHSIAAVCGAHPEFRLATYDANSHRWPQVIPGVDNAETNWITFTALISIDHWQVLLDYMAEDYAEIIEHYYLPRVKLYLDKLRELARNEEDVSGRLVDRGTDSDLPSRVADWATPDGLVPWSAHGDTCEPELTEGDETLALELIRAGSVGGKFDFYEGDIEPFIRSMLDRYPPPDDFDRVASELDEVQKGNRRALTGKPGDRSFGLICPGFVEKVDVPQELEHMVIVESARTEYNISRGEVSLYSVRVIEHVQVERLDDVQSPAGDRNLAVFGFSVMGRDYSMTYDPGTATSVAALRIESRGG